MMDSREKNIIEAAMRLYSRYGVKRTTMNDIAEEAGVARQTLYNVYSGKDELLRGVMRYGADLSLERAVAELRSALNLGEQLEIVFRHFVLWPYETIHALPDAQDLIEGFNTDGKQEIARSNKQKRALLAELLLPYESQIANLGLSVEELAEVVQISAAACKNGVERKEDLIKRLEALRRVVMMAIGVAPS